MNTRLEVLEAEALKLAPADRSHLLARLLASLDADPEVEQAWGLEADRRESELADGTSVPVRGQEAIARLRSKLTQWAMRFILRRKATSQTRWTFMPKRQELR
jgi:hypothetical protein